MPQQLHDPRVESIRALAAMVDAEMRTNDGAGSGGQGSDTGGSGSGGSSSGTGDGTQGGSGSGSGDGNGQQGGSGSNGGSGDSSQGGDRNQRSDTDRHLDDLLGGNSSGRGSGSGTGQDGNGSGSGSSAPNLSESEQRILDALSPHMQSMGDRIADRLVNAEGTRQRRSQRDQGNGSGRDQSRDQDRGGNDRDQQNNGNRRDERDDRAVGEQREAEQELRFELRDVRPRGATREDRSMAEAIGARFLADNLADGQRPSRAARNAAESAHGVMEAFAKSVREDTVASLRRRGAIREGAGDGKGGGSSLAGGPGNGGDTSTENAIALAKQMAEQHNRHNGHPAPSRT